MKTKILIVEPSELLTDGLRCVFGEQSRFRLLEPAHNLDDIESRMNMFNPEVVIVNPSIPGVHEFLSAYGDCCNVIALVYQYVPQSQIKMFDSVIDVCDGRGTIVEKVVRLLGQKSKSHQAAVANPDEYELTKRETAVLVLVAKGMMNKEIAEALNVSVHTVITHRKNIMHKTGIKSVAGLTIYAMLHNLIDDISVVG